MGVLPSSAVYWRDLDDGPRPSISIEGTHKHDVPPDCLKLAAFDFVIRHRPGKKDPADAPSRRPDYEPKEGENLSADTLQRKFCHS